MERAFNKHAHNTMYNGPSMHDGGYAGGPIGPGPKSPGQETFTTAYSAVAPSTIPSQQFGGAAYGMVPSGYPASTGSPPPLSEYSQSLYNVHGQQQQQQQHGAVQGLITPLVGKVDGGNAMQNGFL